MYLALCVTGVGSVLPLRSHTTRTVDLRLILARDFGVTKHSKVQQCNYAGLRVISVRYIAFISSELMSLDSYVLLTVQAPVMPRIDIGPAINLSCSSCIKVKCFLDIRLRCPVTPKSHYYETRRGGSHVYTPGVLIPGISKARVILKGPGLST